MSTAESDLRDEAAANGDLRVAQGQSTRALLLSAASDLLREEGFAATSTRAVAERAGTRLSLVHYHFGSKRGLLLAVLEDHTERLLDRQRAMFSDSRSLADQWRSACAYLRADIESGYVRVLWELWAAGLADPELAARWSATQRRWRELIEARIERFQIERGVELPMPPRALATLIGNLFEGAEAEILAGVPDDEAPHMEALEACGDLIASVERG